MNLGSGTGNPIYIKPDMSATAKLPMTQPLFQIASEEIESGFDTGLVATHINQRLYPEQKLWQNEIIQVAAMIENTYSSYGLRDFTFGLMMIELNNTLKWRVVSPIACIATKKLDPVTRQCVDIPIVAPVCKEGYYKDTSGNCVIVEIVDATKKSSLLSGNMAYILIGIVVLFLLGKK
jgi:hypothetical protein